MKNICVLAFSGGLDTSAIIPWLKENYDLDVIAYCCNVGNLPPKEELQAKAMKLGASNFIYEEAQDEFVSNFVNPMLKAGATYFDDYLLGTAIARPLIASRVARYAKSIGATAIAHGATGKGNDHIRFERAWAYLCPNINIIAPWKLWKYSSREEIVQFLAERSVDWSEKKKSYSVDLNTFHSSTEGGELEHIHKRYSESVVFQWLSTSLPQQTSNISIYFEKGEVTAINGVSLSPRLALESLNEVGAQYQIGLCDIVEERINGITSRGLYETPGGTIIRTALKALKQICWSRDLYKLSQTMGVELGTYIYEGQWFSDQRHAIAAFFDQACQTLSGEIALEIKNHSIKILSRKSQFSLYDHDLVSFESDHSEINQASSGYTKILTLSSGLQGQRARLEK